MTAYIKIDGTWTPSKRPYIKRNGVWTPAKDVYVKRSGAYAQSFEYDKTPSASPEVSLQIMDNRYIQIGLRLPGNTDDTDLKMIRLLASKSAMPTTQFGSGYIYTPDNTWPNEPWSDWYYHGANPVKGGSNHGDSMDWDYKEYPVNPTDKTNLPGGQYYYFAAWSCDMQDNWSAGTFTKIWMPKDGVQAAKRLLKEANFDANSAGSVDANGANFVSGDLIAQDNPRSNGLWFHSNKITSRVGEQGSPTVTSARIRVTRGNDTGQATANVHLFWHGKSSSSDLPIAASEMMAITNVGTINKGETKWFDIPSSYFPHFNTDIKGFGLAYGNQASDYIVASGIGTDLRSGEVNVVWEEAL